MWARKLPALDSMHMSSLWLFSTHHPHLHGQKDTWTWSSRPLSEDRGVPFPNNPEPSSRACPGLFSGSGTRVSRTARIPTPSPRDSCYGGGRMWTEILCKTRVPTCAKCHKEPTVPDGGGDGKTRGVARGCGHSTLSSLRILNLTLTSNHESTSINIGG